MAGSIEAAQKDLSGTKLSLLSRGLAPLAVLLLGMAGGTRLGSLGLAGSAAVTLGVAASSVSGDSSVQVTIQQGRVDPVHAQPVYRRASIVLGVGGTRSLRAGGTVVVSPFEWTLHHGNNDKRYCDAAMRCDDTV